MGVVPPGARDTPRGQTLVREFSFAPAGRNGGNGLWAKLWYASARCTCGPFPNIAFRIIRCKNRYLTPRNGWGDCTFYFQADERGMSAVAELQIVHNKLMLVREDMQAHDTYERHRFLAEIL